MERVTAIYQHDRYQSCLRELEVLEKERMFCKHTIEHFLNVARITYIKVLERGLSVPKELIYGAALLHDIGKARQYTEGVPHEQVSAELAALILEDTGFGKKETEMIVSMILQHRKPNEKATLLEQLFYEADKASRDCYACSAEKDCNWSDLQKNHTIDI